MTELLKLWREYESSVGIQNGEDMGLGRSTTIEIRIPAKLVTTSNHQVCSFHWKDCMISASGH